MRMELCVLPTRTHTSRVIYRNQLLKYQPVMWYPASIWIPLLLRLARGLRDSHPPAQRRSQTADARPARRRDMITLRDRIDATLGLETGVGGAATAAADLARLHLQIAV